ncbi:MAG: NAD(P)-binding domain-containing protein [Syntrophales bacterium]|nr:NAD(P)-binding domain-containing protein [Syntrophales bacterium]
MKKEKSLGFIGGGRITQIILTGLRNKDQWPGKVIVSDPDAGVLGKLKKKFPLAVCHQGDNGKAATADIVFFALHPPAIGGVLAEIKSELQPGSVLVSLAPKATIAALSAGLGGFNRIVRMIPNAPSVINRGYNPLSFSPAFDGKEKKELLDLFKVLGDCPEVAEEKLEAYAILTAMGPTYFTFQLDELQRLGESFSLTTRETQKGLSKMMKGAMKTLFESDLSFSEVADLIPVKPLGDEEGNIRAIYREKLGGLYRKLKG